MSQGLVQLAADLASFNNIGVDEALLKLQSGLVGETEPLRALGVNLNAAAVQAEALKMGLAANVETLTAADMAQARYALILQQTTTAQGDLARTSDGWANQNRILQATLAGPDGGDRHRVAAGSDSIFPTVGGLRADFRAGHRGDNRDHRHVLSIHDHRHRSG